MDIRSLEIFVAVAKFGSASKAAESLHITQPAVSWTINKLEQHYGVRLFDRTSRQMNLNEAGYAVLPKAKEVLSQFASFEHSIKRFGTAQVLSVGFSFGQNMMLSYCRDQMTAAYPDIKLSAMYGNSLRVYTALQEGTLDFGIFAVDHPIPGFQFCTLWEDELHFICNSCNPLLKQAHPTFADLIRYPAFLREQGHFARDCFDKICEVKGVHVMPFWQGIDNRLLIDTVLHGNGFTLLTTSDLIGHDKTGLSSILLEDVRPTMSVVVAYRRDRILSAADHLFIRSCQEISDNTPME